MPPRALNERAIRLQSEGRCREALTAFREAAELYRAEGDERGEGRCLNGVGASYKDLGEWEHARDYLERALTLRRSSGDVLGEAVTLTTLGPVYQAIGVSGRAREVLLRALGLTRQIGAYNRSGQALFNLAEVSERSGRLGDAHRYYREAMEVARNNEDIVEMTKCLGGMVTVTIKLGLTEEAFRLASGYLHVAREQKNPRALSAALHALGTLYEQEGDLEAAIEHLSESVQIDLENDAEAEAAITLDVLAAIERRKGDSAAAVRLARRALTIAESAGALSVQSHAEHTIGSILFDQSDYASATAHLERSRSLAQRTGARLQEAFAIAAIAAARHGQGHDAFPMYEEALTLFDTVRGNVAGEEHRVSFFGQTDIQNVYAVYTHLLLDRYRETGEPELAERAFFAYERRKARALLDLLHRSTDIEQSAAPITLRDAQALLDAQTVLLQYSIHLNVGYVWALTRDGCTLGVLPGSREIEKRVEQLRNTMSDDDARQLYDILVGPVESSLDRRTRVVIVPDFVLHSLPFGMLRRGSRPLLQDFVISYAPSSSVMATLVKRRGGRTASRDFIGLAPICAELPATRTEVEEIAALFAPSRTRVSVGTDMTKDTLQAMDLRDYRYVHFATHGIVNERYPDGSAILLSTDGSELLRPSEVIRDFPLDAELVVLSACDTGRGALSKGEGILGLMRAFFSAGARSVCATLWPVNDHATGQLMVAFYRHLRAGLGGAEALREAQLELAKGTDFEWPGFWAPFIFAGPPTNA